MREKQTDEGQEAPIRPQKPCAVFQALQERDTDENRPALSCGRAGDDMGRGAAAVRGLSLRLAHRLGRQKELPQQRRRHLRLHRHYELLHGLQSGFILPRDRGDGGKPDPSDLPQTEIRGLQQTVLEEADVQGVCSCEKRLRQMARLRDVGCALSPNLLVPFQNMEVAGYDAVEFVPPKTLYRLVDCFPEDVFDGKALSTPYLSINLQDSNATLRVREDSKDRILSFIKDTLRVISWSGQRIQKNELTRASLSVDFLVRELES